MQVRYEYFSESYPRFGVYDIKQWADIQQYYLHEHLSQIVEKSYNYPWVKQAFLLDESRFSFFRFDIYLDCPDGFTIQMLHDITAEKMNYIEREQGVSWWFLSTYVDSIFVNWEEKQRMIWESGTIFFRLYIIYIDYTSLNQFDGVFGKVRENKNIEILPQSFHTTLFLRNNLKRENFFLLYISENSAKIIKISNSFYEWVKTLNLWMWALKQMYKDNWILPYRYKSSEDIQWNTIAEWLIVDTIDFFSTLFFSRLETEWYIWSDMFLVSPIVKNWYFMEVFNKKYREYSENYIIPFHYSDKLDTFDKVREPEDMDTLIYLNSEK